MSSTAPSYSLLSEFVTDIEKTPNPDFTSCAPFWVICIFPLAIPLTFSRSSMSSVDALPGAGAGLRDAGKIIITDDCMALTIASKKEQHVKSLSMSLMHTDRNYLVDLLPGDWIMAWICNSEEKGRDVAKRARQGKPCNDFTDGLKFVGRINSIRKHMERTADGILSSSFAITCSEFSELDSQFFYDQNLADTVFAGSAGIESWAARFGLDFESLMAITIQQQEDNVHKIIPSLLELFLGKGVSSSINPIPQLPAATGGGVNSDQGKEAPFAYLVPKEVGDLLGKTSRDVSKAGGCLAYCDILTTIFGVQTYSNTNAQSAPYRAFVPDLKEGNNSFFYTGTPMLGAFIPIMPQLTNRPLWSVLTQYLNPTVNEMYTCLRVNGNGKVVPTLMLRQIPFTTDAFVQKNDNQNTPSGSFGTSDQQINVTPFLSLPRWKMHPSLVQSVNIGRSDSTRTNFVHVYGQNDYATNNITVTEQLVNNPPIHDDLDIQRSGLRTYMTTVAVDAFDQAGKAPRVWMEFVADMMIGSQYTLNGSIVSRGISRPICEGDNLEFDGTCYHIEGITHSCSIDYDGNRSFITSIDLSNGMRIPTDNKKLTDTANADSDTLPQYPGFDQNDNTTYDPGITHDDGKGPQDD